MAVIAETKPNAVPITESKGNPWTRKARRSSMLLCAAKSNSLKFGHVSTRRTASPDPCPATRFRMG